VVLFSDPLVVTVSDAIVVDHPPVGQASMNRLLDNVVGATMPDKVVLIVRRAHRRRPARSATELTRR